MERISKVFLAGAIVLFLAVRLVLAQATIEVPVVWDQEDPENVIKYDIYISYSQSQFSNDPYKSVTRLPTENSPIILHFPPDGRTRYIIIKAINDIGESESSNEIWFTPTLTTGDVYW